MAASAGADASVLTFAKDVALGMSDRPRWLPCRYLYDAVGSDLFERICETPEYYPTRTEAAILKRHAAEISSITGPVALIELGSGSSTKTGHLLTAYARTADEVHYLPVDVSDSILRYAVRAIEERHPTVRVTGINGTYESAFPLLKRHSPSMLLFLGSTIGNLNQSESVVFWRQVAKHTAPGDYFLLGVDLVKDPAVLNAAYNDASGVTAQFTRNLFVRMNRELGAGIDVDQVEHVARFNPEWNRMEISARFHTAQTMHVRPLHRTFSIAAGEQILTEISRKFILDDYTGYLGCFGFEVRRVFTDERRWFAVLLLQKGADDDHRDR